MLRALEFYSGIGGLHRALTRSAVDAKVVRAFDWDQLACQVYNANYGPNIARKTDVLSLSAADLISLNADLWLLSPSCQPYTTINPMAKGEADPRAKSFLHLIDVVLPDLQMSDAHPQFLLVENVAGFEASSTRTFLLAGLQSLGYTTFECLLTPLQYGIPNSRLRYYMLARRSKEPFPHTGPLDINKVWKHIPGPSSSPIDVSELPLTAFLDDGDQGEYAIPDRVLSKWGRLFDIVLPSANRSCCFTRGYTHLVERAGSILQMNTELDTSAVFDEFLYAQSEGRSDAIECLRPLQLRYFTPSELLRLFCFEPPIFIWPASVSLKVKYRLIGNSVNIKVVSELIRYLSAV